MKMKTAVVLAAASVLVSGCAGTKTPTGLQNLSAQDPWYMIDGWHYGRKLTAQEQAWALGQVDQPDTPDFAGMTVNERLFEAGILDQWVNAARRRNRDAMIELLRRVKVASPERTADAIISNLQKYGF